MKYVRVLGSRLLLVPLCLGVGVVAGINGTFHYMYARMADDCAMQAYLWANVAAEMDDGHLAAARSQARDLMAKSAQSFMNMASKAEAEFNRPTMRQIATYATCSDDSSDGPATQLGSAFLAQYPPLSRAEAEKSHCTAAICNYNRAHAPMAR